MINLRPYQNQALDTVMSRLRQKRFVLLQLPVGGGKTVIFSELIKRWMTEYPAMRIGVLAHRQELITQARDKLLKVWPEGFRHIGLACAAVGQVDTKKPVVIGSVQTLARRKLKDPIHLLIVDESHHIPSVETGGQYHQLIDQLSDINPQMRVLGVSATCYRLGHGYTYGQNCKPGHTNIFDCLDYTIDMDDLIAEGHLVPIRAKEGAGLSADLARVKIKGGEYDASELNSLLTRGVHIQSAVDAYEKYGEGRSKVLIFAVSIEHAERLAAAFNEAGHHAAAVHSKMQDQSRRRILHHFDHGDLKVLANVGILTEGWDSPAVDLIMMCRPTKAPALFVQMIGRGTRLHPGKEDLLVLDLAENFKTHGAPSDPIVRAPGQGGGEPPYKVCPDCAALIHTSILKCPECGHQWEVRLVDEEKAPAMTEVKLRPAGKSWISQWQAAGYITRRGHFMLRLDFRCLPGGQVSYFLDFDGAASAYGRQKAQIIWWQLSNGKVPPQSVREAESRLGEIKLPPYVTVITKNGYKAVKEF